MKAHSNIAAAGVSNCAARSGLNLRLNATCRDKWNPIPCRARRADVTWPRGAAAAGASVSATVRYDGLLHRSDKCRDSAVILRGRPAISHALRAAGRLAAGVSGNAFLPADVEVRGFRIEAL